MIELMIVLVIMGFVLAFAGPRVAKGLSGLSLKTSVKKVAGMLRYARSKAVNSGTTYNVIFDSQKNRAIVMGAPVPPSFNITEQEAATGEQTENEDDPEQSGQKKTEKEIKIYPLPKGIVFSKITVADAISEQEDGDGIYQMAFFPNGTTQGGEIIIADDRERMFNIKINFMTGVVSVAEQTEQ